MQMLQSLFYLTIANHVEQSSDKINSVTCASCWDFYIRILLRCTDRYTYIKFNNSVNALL